MNNQISLRRPVADDGAALHALVKRCPPLDLNSMYCNLLQVTHFAETSIVAERDDELVGFVTGYMPPEKQDVLFVWQVAVAEQARGMGLGDRMLHGLVDRLPQVRALETTVTPDNVPSEKMFRRFASDRSAEVTRTVLFSRHEHFDGQHDDELLYRIEPLHPVSK